jgi:hypothetical protein
MRRLATLTLSGYAGRRRRPPARRSRPRFAELEWREPLVDYGGRIFIFATPPTRSLRNE